MMKHEFEARIGHSVSQECYERIELVYAACDMFQNKDQIADFYKRYDMNGIEPIYRLIVAKEKAEAEARNLAEELDAIKDAAGSQAQRLRHYEQCFADIGKIANRITSKD